MSSHAECIPRGAYAPRSCFAMRTSADEKTIFAIHIRPSGQERRALARRGSEIAPARTIPRTSTHARRTQHQERRASARRGFVNRVSNCNAMNFAASSSHRMLPTGALRLRRLHLECAEGDEFARRIHPTGAYAPRSCFAMRTSADEKTIFAIHIRTSGQERWASARRGPGIAPAGRFDLRSANNATKSGGRQPAVVRESHLRGQFRAHPHTTVTRSTKSGGR
jgi:hypothetical protein